MQASSAINKFLEQFNANLTEEVQKQIENSGHTLREIVTVASMIEKEAADDEERVYNVDVDDEDADELIDIVSEGMIIQWLKPYVYQQDLLQNVLNTRDYSVYSPAELLMRVGNAYRKAQNAYTQMIREYSYNHGDLSDLLL